MTDLPIYSPPRRVVSLVPSTTESLFVLGFGKTVVGITDYCSEPAGEVTGLKRVGGPKNLQLEEILDLSPDLVIANQEENSREIIEYLIQNNVPTWLTFPKSIHQSLDDLLKMAAVYQSSMAVAQIQYLLRLLDPFENSLFDQSPKSYFCPIWQDSLLDGTNWWMTFNQNTYPHDVLRLFGGKNIFADRNRRYPIEADLGKANPEPVGERDDRYPCVSVEEVIKADPELIILPTEPYAYDDSARKRLRQIFKDTRAGKSDRIHVIDGRLIMWHGVHLSHALKHLPGLFI